MGHTDIPATQLASCDQEPIHIPGAIQPFGVLLTVHPDTLGIDNVSENCADHWGIPAKDLIDRSFAMLLLPEDAENLRQYVSHPRLRDQSPLPLSLPSLNGSTRVQWELFAHVHAGVLFLELEPVAGAGFDPDAVPLHRKVHSALRVLGNVRDFRELCDAAVREVHAITGFERVMLYRFDAEWHGEVIAEALSGQASSYLGHHFPASDIPAQARNLFMQNALRMIPNADYAPCPIYPGQRPDGEGPLDLTRSMLRSVSPIHIEYLKNMNVGASLTLSLLVDGQLWGLIACHHGAPRLISSESRHAAMLVAHIVSLQVKVMESLDDLDYKSQLQKVQETLTFYMRREDDLGVALTRYAPNLLDIAGATGAAASISDDGQWRTVGATPSLPQIEALVTWLTEQHADEPVFSTDSLSTLYPAAAEYKDLASGLLAVAIPRTSRTYLLWFRPEVPTRRIWAGNPDKPVVLPQGATRLHPRKSFHSWRQEVSGKSAPWERVELKAVERLRNNALACDLQRRFGKELEARQWAERLSKEKEEMVMAVSHDLKVPLGVTKMCFELLELGKDRLEDVARELVCRGSRAVSTMENLIVDILDISRIESGTLELKLKLEPVAAMVAEVADMFSASAAGKGVKLTVDQPPEDYMVLCERGRIFQVLSNLVSNAVKFTPLGGRVRIAACNEGNAVRFSVEDSGPGIEPEYLAHVFDRFWQAKEVKLLGTGLGLAIAKGLVERHHGAIWAESTPGSGTTFHFTIPEARS